MCRGAATPSGSGFQSHGVPVSRRHAYVADGRVLICDISAPNTPMPVSTIPQNSPGSFVFALGPEIAGRHLNITGVPGGLSVYDISDPSDAVFVGSHLTGSSCTYRWGAAVRGDHAYVPDVHHGLVVYDLFPG